MKRYLFWIVMCVWIGPACGQSSHRIVFYNVENLFDTFDDPLTRDDEFTPQGAKHWTRERYMTKLRKLSEALDSIGGGKLPLVVGLAEVENRKVLEDLTEKTVLADGQYGIVHCDSPDARGIDVALLYRKNEMELLETDFLRIPFPEDSTIRTRDILYAKTLFRTDTLHFFVCHFAIFIQQF